MNQDHIKSLIEQIEFAHSRGITCEHSEAQLVELKSKLEGSEPVLSWAEQVEACKDKDTLEALVLDRTGNDLDKRKGLKKLKEYALTLAQ